jgi:acyl-CoA reductase-like NAD-dependent aldehyde dehydrogenase
MPEILKVTSPFDRHFIREFPLAGDKEAEQALSKAYALFRDPSRHLPKYLRIEILEKLAALMSLQVEELTRIAAEEGGKPYKDSKVEVLRAINGVKLAADPRIGYLTFIGSHDVGWRLRTILAPGTRVALGHGGVAPVIVDETADLSAIIQPIAKGGFYHAGQVCVSVQKVFVHESRAREFAEKLAEEAEKLIVGDPLDPNTDVGPMIAESEVNRVREWVEEAISNGAENLSAKLQAPNTKLNPKSQAPNTKLNSNANSKNQNLIRQIAKSPNRQIVQSFYTLLPKPAKSPAKRSSAL